MTTEQTTLQQIKAVYSAIYRTAMPELIAYCKALDNYSEIIAGLILCDDKAEDDDLEEAFIAVEAARARLESILTAHQPKGGGEE